MVLVFRWSLENRTNSLFTDCKFNCHRKGCAEKAPKNCRGEVALIDTGEDFDEYFLHKIDQGFRVDSLAEAHALRLCVRGLIAHSKSAYHVGRISWFSTTLIVCPIIGKTVSCVWLIKSDRDFNKAFIRDGFFP